MNNPFNPSRKNRTEYLVLRKFPFARAIEFPPSLNVGSPRRGSGASPELREALAAYRAELAALSDEEVVERYNAEKQRERQQAVAKAEREEQQRFYNQLHALADWDYWSKMPHWTLDEAVALSFGKEPNVVNWPTISKYLQISSFAVEYSRRRELAVRAVPWKQLYDPVLPSIFLAWAKRNEIEMPAALVNAIGRRDRIADWKSLYDELKALHDEKEKAWRATDEAKDRLAATLQERVRKLEAAQAEPPPEKSLGAKERDSLLKIVIGIAVDSYKYDPKLSRSTVPQEIADDLVKCGIVLDVDTVRKWLREAAELLPPKENK